MVNTFLCPYCEPDTGGNHELSCPFYVKTVTTVYVPNGKTKYIDASKFPFKEPITQ